MSSPPIRVVRTGWRGVLPLTREQVRQAATYAEEWARPITWKSVEDLMHGLAWSMIEQLNRPLTAHLIGMHDVDDMPVIRVHVGELMHHVAMRGARLLENDTMDLLLGDVRVEEAVERRLRESEERRRQEIAAKKKAGVKVR